MEKQSSLRIYRLEVSGDLNRRSAEALRLEIRRLAKRYDVAIGSFKVETADETSA